MPSNSGYPNQYYPSQPSSQPPLEPEGFNSYQPDQEQPAMNPYPSHTTAASTEPPLSPTDHRRRPSYPMSTKHSYTSSEYTTKPDIDSNSVHYPPMPTGKEVDVDARPFWQKLLPDSMACRLYILTVIVQTTIDLAIEGDLLIRFNQIVEADEIKNPNTPSRRMPVYLSIFALAHVFQLVMAIDAVRARNTLQFISLTLFNALFLVYAIIQVGEIRQLTRQQVDLSGGTSVEGISNIPVNVLTAIIPVVISVAEIAYIALGWKIYNEFGWKVYKHLGADRRIKKMFATYQIFEVLVKYDVFFWVGFSVQFIWLVLNKNDWEYYVTIAALPLSVVLLIEGHLAAQHENKWMMATFMSGCVGALVYFIYKLGKVIVNRNTDVFVFLFKTLTTFSVIAIVLLIVTFIFAILVMRNFGRGLKDAMTKKRAPQYHSRFPSQPHQRMGSKNLNRMSIE